MAGDDRERTKRKPKYGEGKKGEKSKCECSEDGQETVCGGGGGVRGTIKFRMEKLRGNGEGVK